MWLRRFLAFFLLVTLTFSSVAMPVFTHICSGMDKTWSSFFVPPSSCCAASASKEGKCESISMENQGCWLSKLPCCENDVSLVALGANYTLQIYSEVCFSSLIANLETHFSQFGIDFYTNPPCQTIAFDHSPTPRFGRSLLIFEQLFLC